MNKCLKGTEISESMIQGKTTLNQKYLKKKVGGTASYNYRPITCPPMRKILTVQIREAINYLQLRCGLFPRGKKGCCKGPRGTGDLLYIDQHILKESKTKYKNSAIA